MRASTDKAYLACSTLLFGLLSASDPLAAETAQPAPPSKADMRVIDQKNWLTISQATSKDEDTPQNRKLADRRKIIDAFERYQQAGGMAQKYRFARVFSSTSGFAGTSASGDDEDGLSKKEIATLRSHPAAFDLVCNPRSKPASDRTSKEAKDSGEDPPETAPLRFSVDVPAGLWRPENAFIQPMHVEKDGALVTRWQVDLDRSSWGEPKYDRISHDYTESISTTDPVSKKVSRAVVRAKCKVAPFSGLFGAPRG